MKTSPVINSFNAGELSKRMYGRPDFDKYNSGCLVAENVSLYPQGGATKRPALKYAETSKADDKIRMIPFIYSSDDAYHMEFGPLYVRFIKDGEYVDDPASPGNPLEIVTEYLESELLDLDYAQIADVMWITHPNHEPSTISRTAADAFTFAAYALSNPPYFDENETDFVISPTAISGSVSVLSDGAVFNAGHVGTVWKSTEVRSPSRQTISGTTTVDGITDNINMSFSNWTITTRGIWSGKVVIQRTLDYGVTWKDYIILADTSAVTAGTDAGNFTLSSDEPEPANTFLRLIVSGLTVYSSNFNYSIVPESNDLISTFLITGFTSAFEVTADILSPFQNVVADYVAWSASVYGLGALVTPSALEYYECVIAHTGTVFATDLAAGYWVKREPRPTTWSESAWSDYRGWPRAVTFFESRLCFAGTDANTNRFWLSKADEFNNFLLGSLDTDGMQLTMASASVNDIRWVVDKGNLVIGTSGSEWMLESGSDNKTITPTSFLLQRKSTYGSRNSEALLVEDAILFTMRQGLKIREYNFDIQNGSYKGDDLTILSNDITETGIVNIGYAQQPDSNIICVRNDGQLAVLEYEPTQNVIGWSRYLTDGVIESISVIPKPDDEDEVCVSVRRVIDGNTKRYIEIFDKKTFDGDLTTWSGQDSYIVATSPGSTTITGLDHLEGETVAVLVDGAVEASKVVASGQIDTDVIGDRVVVGLPYTSKLAPMYIEPTMTSKASQGMSKGSSVCRVRFTDTNYAKVGSSEDSLELVNFRRIGDDMDSPVALFNDVKKVRFDNVWEPLKTCYIVSDVPLPMTVLAMIPDMEVRN